MKIILIGFCLLLSLLSFSQTKDETTILKILDTQTAAWNKGDIDAFMQGYWKSDSLKFVGKNGITYGWTRTLNNYKKNYPDTAAMGKLHFDILTLKLLSKEYCHVIGKWSLQRSIGNLSGYFTLIFRKIEGNWVIVADHSS